MIVSKKTAGKLASGINETAAPKPAGFGKKMLEKMGWQEGEGLGAEGNGMRESVKVIKKDDTKGLGAQAAESKEQADQEKDWWNDAFKKAAKGVPDRVDSRTERELSTSSSSDSSDDSSSESSSSDDDNGIDMSKLSEADRELYLMCGKRRLGRRANRNQKGKWKREADAEKKLKEETQKARALLETSKVEVKRLKKSKD